MVRDIWTLWLVIITNCGTWVHGFEPADVRFNTGVIELVCIFFLNIHGPKTLHVFFFHHILLCNNLVCIFLTISVCLFFFFYKLPHVGHEYFKFCSGFLNLHWTITEVIKEYFFAFQNQSQGFQPTRYHFAYFENIHGMNALIVW